MEALRQPTVRVCAVIAEGVPERDAKQLIAYARGANKVVIGPATVGGVQVRGWWGVGGGGVHAWAGLGSDVGMASGDAGGCPCSLVGRLAVQAV